MTLPAVQEDWNLTQIGHFLRDPTLTYEHYALLCSNIGLMHHAWKQADAEIRFAVGDAILMGEQLFGEDCYQAIEEMGISEESRRECVRICAAVPRSIRRKGLTWSHHRAVAALRKTLPSGEKIFDRDAQRGWLKRAVDESMSHHEMRDALRNGAAAVSPQTCRCCGRSL